MLNPSIRKYAMPEKTHPIIEAMEPQNLWAVVYTKAGKEREALRGITEQRYLAWMPECMVKLRKNRAHRFEARPLFPRYLFVVVPPERPWSPIANTRGVSRLLTYPDGSLCRIPHRAIKGLQDRQKQDGGAIRLDGPAPTRARFIPGETVRVDDGGPFHGLHGLVQQDKGGRVSVLMGILGRVAPVEMRPDQIAAVA
mgnify:CR=1 FL=1